MASVGLMLLLLCTTLLMHATSACSGSVYTRWGRKTCPSGTDLVYEGVVGGGHYTHQGSGSDYLCLTLEPEYTTADFGTQWETNVYGSEYGMIYSGSTLLHHRIPCAVCSVNDRSRQIMIPGRVTCPTSWTKEYSGKLATGYHTHAAQRNHVCLDQEPESGGGGAADDNGALLYIAQGICGSLPCAPDGNYQNGKELNCVVCTK